MDEQSKEQIVLNLHEDIQKNANNSPKRSVVFMKKLTFGAVNAAILIILTIVLFNEVDFNQNTTPLDEKRSYTEGQQASNKQTDTDNGDSRDYIENTENTEGQTDSVPEPHSENVLEQFEITYWEVVESANSDGKVKDFDSKKALTGHFMRIMSPELARWHVETYFKEEDDGLYVIPTDSPTFFTEEKPYEVEKVDQRKYKVIQERQNEMIGHVKMIYILSFKEDKWIVEAIASEDLEEES